MANETFSITETIVHRPGADTDGDGVIDPGEVVRTTVTIVNNSTTDVATGLEFTQILAGMTIFDQPGLADINVSPIAAPDSYNVIGNTTFVVSAADGILNGATAVHFTASADMEFFGATIGANTATQTHIVTTGVIATTGAGSVSLGADGGFTYTPDAGFTGTDTFTYTLTDAGLDGNFATLGDNLTSTGTVSFIVEDLVWFIDNSAAVNGDGTQASPFNSIANFNAVNNGAVQANPGTGDYIYLREGTGTYSTADGINLLDGQILIGQGENLVINHSGQGNLLIESGSAADTPVILVTGAGNQGIQLAQNNTIRGLDVGMNNATAVGIKDNGGSVGALTISNVGVGVGNSLGQAIEFDNGGTLNVLLESVTSSGAIAGIDISGVAGTGNHFTVSGLTTVNDATQFGVLISSSSVNGTFTGEVTVLNDGVGADGSGINLSTNTGTYNFNGGVDVIVNGPVIGLNIQSSNVVNILDPNGTNQIISNNGMAIFVNPTTVNATLNSVTSSGGSSGISLTGMSGSLTIATVDIDGQTGDGIDVFNSAGSLTINGGTIGATNDPGGIGVDIQGSNGNVTIGATINKNSAGGFEVIEVTARTGGTVDFNANITSSVGGGGIDINGNTGGTVRFDGGMSLSTGTAAAFNSTGNTSTTIVVTDPGAGSNTLTTSTGIALNVANTTIGAEDLTFQSINSTGASNGIILNTTGALGGLTVTGTGAANSGGTIANSTGAGVSLTSTRDISFTDFNINNSDTDGISGSTVTNLVLLRVDVTNNGDAVQERGVDITNLLGTATVTNSTFTGNAEDNFYILNNSGTLTSLDITGSTFSNNSSSFGNDGIHFQGDGTANMSISVSTSTFDNNRGDHFQVTTDAVSSAVINADFLNNTLSGDGGSTMGGNDLGGGITINTSGSSQTTFNIIGNGTLANPWTGQVIQAILVSVGGASTAAALLQGNIIDNVIGDPAIADSGSPQGDVIDIFGTGDGTVTVLIQDNILREYNNLYGIQIRQNDGSGRINATVTGNTISDPGTFGGEGIMAFAGSVAGDNGSLYLDMTGNTLGASGGVGGAGDFRVRQRIDTDVYLEGYGGGLSDTAAVVAFLQAANIGVETGTATVQNSPPHGFHNVAAVPLPPAPLFAVAPAPTAPDDGAPGGGGTGGEVVPPTPDPVTGDPTVPAGDPTDPADDPAPAPHPVIVDDGILSQAELDYFAGAAAAIWTATGLTAAQAAVLESLTFTVADMASLTLGSYRPGLITLDNDGAGYGWFLDATPLDDAEFTGGAGTRITAAPGSAPAGDFDLLTTLLHEMGHALGIGDTYDAAGRDDLMYGYLFTGERRLPGEGQADGAVAGSITSEEFAGSPITVNGGNSSTGAFVLPVGTGVTIQWDATIDLQSNDLIVHPSNQGLLTAGNAVGFPDTLTDDPSVVGASDPTVTALDTLTLGGTVWLDNGAGGGTANNGIKEGGETIVDNVLVTLFADTGSVVGSWDATDTQIGGSILTGGGGNYSFTGLAPGEYIVRIDQDNFDNGGNVSLLNRITTTGSADPDDNIDNDDNGAAPGGVGTAVYSSALTLAYNSEPDGTPGGAGDEDGDADDDTNFTVDFGFTSPNQPPQQTDLQGDTATWTEGDGAVLLDDSSAPQLAATITDPDSGNFGGGSLIVTISVGAFPSEEGLFIQSIGDITSNPLTAFSGTVSYMTTEFATYAGGNFAGGNITFTFDDDATPAAVQALVRAMSYNNNGGDDPTAGARIVSWTLNDGDGNANGGNPLLLISSTVDVVAVNDAPVLADAAVVMAAQSEDDPAPVGAVGTLVSNLVDLDTLAGGLDNVTDPDSASIGIAVVATNETDGTLHYSIDGGANWQLVGAVTGASALLLGPNDRLYFQPDAAFDGTIGDAITFRAWDASAGSAGTLADTTTNGGASAFSTATDTGSLTVNPGNLAPVLGVSDTLSYAENDPATVIAPATTLTDSDSADFDTGTVTASFGGTGTPDDQLGIRNEGSGAGQIGVSGANISYGPDAIGTFVGGVNGADLVITLSGSFATPAAVEALLRNITFANTSDDPFTVARTVTFTVTDGDGGSSTDAAQINVTASDDASIANDDAFTITEAGMIAGADLFADNGGGGPDSDLDGPLAITHVNGLTTNVGAGGFNLPSGALLTVLSDGTIDYAPGAVFAPTPTPFPTSGASNTPALEIFTYTLTDGTVGTVTITLTGLDTNDLLLGTAGLDSLSGGGGNDKYVVANSGDTVTELAGGGNDSVSTIVDYQLAAGSHVERLNSISFALTTPLKLTGNEFVNLIEGNAGDNLLDGRGGADTMVGFGGDDKHVVDNSGDVVVELSGGGTDSISTLVDYQLAPGTDVERLNSISWALTTPLKLTGNEIANLIEGNAGNNTLDGREGADRLVGFGGDDKYVVDDAGDIVIEHSGGGNDSISTLVDYTLAAGSHVERLNSISWALTTPLTLTGNELANLIEGNAGANELDGKLGADRLVGFGGADTFAFTTALGGGVDAIADFEAGIDTIALDVAIFNVLSVGALPAGAFVTGSAAADPDDRIVYNSGTGQLFYDSDGNGAGAAVLFATLQTGLSLTASDFEVI